MKMNLCFVSFFFFKKEIFLVGIDFCLCIVIYFIVFKRKICLCEDKGMNLK